MTAKPKPVDWKQLHYKVRAGSLPRSLHEKALCEMIDGLIRYRAAHEKACDARIADDGVLGDYYRDILVGVVGLLDGEAGRLDCGTLWSELDVLAMEAGWKGIDGARADETTPKPKEP